MTSKSTLLVLSVLAITLLLFNDFSIHSQTQIPPSFLISKYKNSLTTENQGPSQFSQIDISLGIDFTNHFTNFLRSKSQFKEFAFFERSDLKGATYGGKYQEHDNVIKVPIIFIHGNSDIGFGRGTYDGSRYADWQTGFRSLANFLTKQYGYTKSELYTFTWGSADANKAQQNNHKKQFVMMTRKFIQAVLQYTGSPKVVIISHSMGVTLSRMAIKGGKTIDHQKGEYYVGQSLSSKVSVFIGIAGGNLGLAACWSFAVYSTCNVKDGFYPGANIVSAPSDYLNQLNTKGGTQADKVYAVWSKYDDVIKEECIVWGKVTCRIPAQTQEIVKTSKEWTHMKLRDDIGPQIIKWIQQ